MNLQMCLNPKVITGLVLIGLGLLIVAPNVALGIIPIFTLAACPLSMLIMAGVMMRSQHGSSDVAKAPTDDEAARGQR